MQHHRVLYSRHGHPSTLQRTDIRKSQAPYKMTIFKNNIATTLTRQLVCLSVFHIKHLCRSRGH